MQKIPVITPSDAGLLLKYFNGVASVLAKRFELGFHPDEEHLTSLLCELLDNQGAELHSLAYRVSDLNKDLKENGSLLHTAISLETTEYNKYQERNFTQADLGIILDYKDYIDYSTSFRKGLLIQAKKLFPDSYNNYRLTSLYKSFNSAQHNRLSALKESFTQTRNDEDEMKHRKNKDDRCYEAFQYLLYNPPLTELPKQEQERILHRQISKESESIFDYTQGLHLYEKLKNPDGIKSLLEMSSYFIEIDKAHYLAEQAASSGRSKSKLAPFDLDALTKSIDIRQRSFAWYLVFEFMLGRVGCKIPDFLDLVSGSKHKLNDNFPVSAPRYVMHVSITAGTNPEKQITQQKH